MDYEQPHEPAGDAFAVGELGEDAPGCCGIVEIELQLETLRPFVAAWKGVAAGHGSA